MNIKIDNILNIDNIDININKYMNSIKNMDLNIKSNNIIDLFNKLKRNKINKGPYCGISLFEAANRIMTDLVILHGVKDLLYGKYENIKFPEYIVEYGNINNNKHDIISNFNGKKLIGEAFNVSSSLFKTKKYSSLKKLRRNIDSDTIIILMYNKDAIKDNYKHIQNINEYHIVVNINDILRYNVV